MPGPTWPPPWSEPPSGAPLTSGEPSVTESNGLGRFAVPEDERYDQGGVLGRGGMGEVRLARDLRLGRDVALKTAHRTDPDALRRLAREAAMTARLEHPNIVPVLGAGRLADGQPFYTMRLLRGRTLAAAVVESPEVRERLGLLRHVLDAAGAVAYAHGQGVLHRDLKPTNVMVGEFGETQVADWGLACTLDEAHVGGVAGTPAWMSPEQARGEPLDARTDVYGLGAILYAVLAGGAAPPEAPRAYPPGVPPPLAAIAERALQADRDARYPSARAFADDLTAWYEGRQVTAHEYTVADHARRLWAAWRAPIVVAGLAGVALVVAIGVGWANTVAQRDRAQEARARAEAAEADGRVSLARALATQARTASAAGVQIEAEILAANALTLDESPVARGVLARFGGRARPRLLARATLPRCEARAVSQDASRLACFFQGDLTTWALDGTPRPLASTPARVVGMEIDRRGDRVVFSDSDKKVWRWSQSGPPDLLATLGGSIQFFQQGTDDDTIAWSARNKAGRVHLTEGTLEGWVPCLGAEMPERVTLEPEGTVLAACADATIVRSDADRPPELLARLAPEDGLSTLAQRERSGPPRVVVTTTTGRVLVYDARTGVLERRLDGAKELLREIDLVGDRLAGVGVDGLGLVWDVGSGELLWYGPAPGAVPRLLEGGRRLRLVGVALEEWEIPASVRPLRYPMGAGVASVTVSPDGRLLAAPLGSGAVRVVETETGRVAADLKWSDRVAKDAAFSPDGTRLAAVVSGDPRGLRVFDTRTWQVVGQIDDLSFRRVVWQEARGLLLAAYQPGLFRWLEAPGGPGRVERLRDEQWLDLNGDAGGEALVGLSRSRDVARLDPDDPSRVRVLRNDPQADLAVPLGEDTLVLLPDRVDRLGPDGAPIQSWPIESRPVDVRASEDGRWMAVGRADGIVEVYAVPDQRPTATLEGHVGRIANLVFSPDGRWLYSSGWDGWVRPWYLADLGTPAEPLRAEIEAAWGRDLDGVLAREE